MSKQKNKIIFWGTSEFALPILKKLIQQNYLIQAVVTAPDKLIGRKQILTPSPIKKLAQENQLKILQPEKPIQILKEIEKIKPDLNIVAAYGQIIPLEIINLPGNKSLNLHPSLLPKYRGPSPIQTALLKNDSETGTTLMLMDEKLDHGPILNQAEIKIDKQDNFQTLQEKLTQLSANLLIQTLPKYLNNQIKPEPQDETQASYTEIITRKHGKIDLDKETAQQIQNKLRAFYPWPGIWTIINNKRIKILKAKAINSPAKNALKTKQGYLLLESVQPEGKKPITGQEFVNGYLK